MKPNLRLSPVTKSFRFRLYLIFTGAIALLTAAFASFYISTEINGFKSTLQREGKLLATILAQNARLPLFAENREALALLAAGTARYPSVLFVSINNAEGIPFTVVKNPRDNGSAGSIDMKVAVTSPGAVFSPEAVLLGRTPVNEERVIGQVHLRLDTSAAHERLEKLVAASLAIGTLFWIIVSLLSYHILKRVTASFNLLMRGIEEIGSGNLSARVNLDSDDELGRGANAINAMAASLELGTLRTSSCRKNC